MSNACFEHLADPPAAFRELARVSAPGAIGLHQIDYRLHMDFNRPLEFLLWPDGELADYCLSTGFNCGNGWRPSEYRELFQRCGFEILREKPNMFAEDAYLDEFMTKLKTAPSRFRSFKRQDLRVLSAHYTVRRQ